MFYYRIFGMGVHSEVPFRGIPEENLGGLNDLGLPLLFSIVHQIEPSGEADLLYSSPYVDEVNIPVTRVYRQQIGGDYWFIYADGCSFHVSGAGTFVNAHYPTSSSLEDLLVYLLGPIFGLVLRLRGVPSLHASSALFGDKAVAFAGAGGAGKSTIAASLALAGVPVLSDDIFPIDRREGQLYTRSAFPQIKLWSSSVKTLYEGNSDALPRLVPGNADWDKRYLDLTKQGHSFVDGRFPIACIYFLERVDESNEEARVEALSPPEALIHMVSHAYVNYALSKAMRARELDFFGRLVKSLPICRLLLPNGLEHLRSLPSFIENDLRVAQGNAISRDRD